MIVIAEAPLCRVSLAITAGVCPEGPDGHANTAGRLRIPGPNGAFPHVGVGQNLQPGSVRGAMMDRIVYKIMSAAELRQMQHDGGFDGSPPDIADGYIHLSCGSQLAATLDKHFSGVDGLMLVAVDLSRLGDTVRWEPARGGQLFPHIHGHLPVGAVVSVATLERTADGMVRLPA
jgi:uncharacterized protein (DUF952 family)